MVVECITFKGIHIFFYDRAVLGNEVVDSERVMVKTLFEWPILSLSSCKRLHIENISLQVFSSSC